MLKRSFDFLGSIAGLVFLAPFFAITALAIKLDSQGPVFFRQERVGRQGRHFRIFKFRSMCAEAGRSKRQVTCRGDNRVTRVGAFLRKHKLDEYPQLINVFRGEMSLVGPRPEVPRYVACYPEKFAKVLEHKPGMTHKVSLILRNEEEVLSGCSDPEQNYIQKVLPWKLDLYLKHNGPGGLIGDLRTIWDTVFCREVHLQKLVPAFDEPLVANVEPFDRHIPARHTTSPNEIGVVQTWTGKR